jgi:hypothetical protein
MKRTTALLLGSYLIIGGMGIAAGQEPPPPPPKVLSIQREFTKPGKNGAVHEKSESAFVQAMMRAKWPTHYLALNALSGKPRALFLTGYDSFEAWEKDTLAEQKNPTLSAAIDRAAMADGELLSEFDASALMYRDEYSLNSAVDIPHMRYFEISLYRVRPGHDADWDAIVKLVKAAYQKIPDVHWAMYQAVYGQEGNTYVIFWPMKTGADVDRSFANDKQLASVLGEDGMKKLSELSSSTIEFYQHNLFAFAPSMSYPSEDWIKADPDFWKPKAQMSSATPKKKTEEKLAQ